MAVEDRFTERCEHRTHQAKRISGTGGVSAVVPTWFCGLGQEGQVEVGPRQCNECPIPSGTLDVPPHADVRIATALQPGVIVMYLCKECGMAFRKGEASCWNCHAAKQA